MAYIQGQRRNAQTIGGQNDVAPTATPGSGAAPGGVAPQAPAASSGPTPQMGGYVNFQNYLGLDSGAGQQMAGRVAGDVRQVGQSAAGQIKADANQFGSKVGAATPQYHGISPQQPLIPGMPSWAQPMTIGDTGNFNQNISAGQYQGAADASTKAAAGATYNGPLDINGAFDKSTGQAQQAQAKAQALQTTGGVQNAISQLYGGAGTSGGFGLDAALTQAVGGSQLASASNQYGDLLKSLGLAEQDATKSISNGQATAQDVQNRYNADAQKYGDYAKEAQQGYDWRSTHAPPGGTPGQPNTVLPTLPNYQPPATIGVDPRKMKRSP